MIYDSYRKKYVRLTPEEEVRQAFLTYLTTQLHYPKGLTAVETPVIINGLRQRADIVIYDTKLHPLMIVECKAPHVKLSIATFQQALRYNTQLGVRFVIVTNGNTNYGAEILPDGSSKMLTEIPDYHSLTTN